jgi:hypothetical protein
MRIVAAGEHEFTVITDSQGEYAWHGNLIRQLAAIMPRPEIPNQQNSVTDCEEPTSVVGEEGTT